MEWFQYLFYCADNIPEGVGFGLFEAGHLIWLAAIAAVVAATAVRYRRATEAGRCKMRRVVCGLMLADECLKIAVLSAIGWYRPAYLPLHLCSINIFVTLWYTIRPNGVAGEILYALSLPGAIVALLSPTWTELPFINLMSFHSFSIHGLLILYPMMLLASGEVRPRLKRLWIPLAFVGGLSPFLYWFNSTFGTNFMFLNGTSDNIILETLESITGSTFYIPGLVILVLTVWFFIYLPWEIKDRRKREKLQ